MFASSETVFHSRSRQDFFKHDLFAFNAWQPEEMGSASKTSRTKGEVDTVVKEDMTGGNREHRRKKSGLTKKNSGLSYLIWSFRSCLFLFWKISMTHLTLNDVTTCFSSFVDVPLSFALRNCVTFGSKLKPYSHRLKSALNKGNIYHSCDTKWSS